MPVEGQARLLLQSRSTDSLVARLDAPLPLWTCAEGITTNRQRLTPSSSLDKEMISWETDHKAVQRRTKGDAFNSWRYWSCQIDLTARLQRFCTSGGLSVQDGRYSRDFDWPMKGVDSQRRRVLLRSAGGCGYQVRTTNGSR